MKELQGWDAYHLVPKNSERITAISMTKLVSSPTAMTLYNQRDELDENEQEIKDTPINFIFKDTMSFLGASLDRSTTKLTESKHSFPYLRQSSLCQTNGVFDEEKFRLLLKKGVYPYDAIQTHQDLNRENYPDKKHFYSSLGIGKDISHEEWTHGLNVWDTFNCENLLNYRYNHQLEQTQIITNIL